MMAMMATTINDIENLAKELDNKYPFSRYSTNYGQILRGVANRTIVHDIIADISEIVFGISKEPYYMSQYKQFLYGYMNECIANVYEKGGKTSLDGFCEAWINIREHENKNTVRERIEQIARNRGLEVDKTIKDIEKTFLEFEHNFKMLKQFSYGTNGYNQYLPLSKNGAALLLNYKFDPCGLPYGLGWSGNIFTEVENEKRKQETKEEEEKIREKEERIESLSKIISIAVVIGIIVLLCIIEKSILGGLFIFVLILAVIKFYASIFK